MNNYLKLEIGSKERGFKLGLGFLEKVTVAEGVVLQELFQKFATNPYLLLPKLLYYSTLYNDERAGTVIDYTIDDVYDWVDEVTLQSEVISTFSIAFADSIKIHFAPEEGKPVPQRKTMKEAKK